MSTLPDASRTHSPQVRLRPRPNRRRHRLSDENDSDRARFPEYNGPGATSSRPARTPAGSGSLHDRSSMDGRQVFPDDTVPLGSRRTPRSFASDTSYQSATSSGLHPPSSARGPSSSAAPPPAPPSSNVPHPQSHPQLHLQNLPSDVSDFIQDGPPSSRASGPNSMSQVPLQPQSHSKQPRDHSVPLKRWMTPAIVAGGYIAVQVISQGTFGTVLKATRVNDNLTVAIKVVAKNRLSEKETANIRKQAITLRTFRHRYIVHFYDDFEDNDYFYHVFEYLHGGDLYDRLESRGKPFSEAQVLFLARQLFYAVSYLHSKRAAHRDLKLENFVFETAATDERQVMKLIDFDLLVVRSRQSPNAETCSEMCGTFLYVSPEIANGREHSPEKSDMWACGVMLFVLLSYYMPFQGPSVRHILRAVRSTDPHFGSGVWNSVSLETKQLVRELLSKDAGDRPTAEQALERVKMIQAKSREPNSGSKLRAIRRGLRSVSLNLWDNSGSLVRRSRPESRREDKYTTTRRAHSNFPTFEDGSSPSSSMRSSFVLHPQMGTGSDVASELEYASGSSRARRSDRSVFDRGGGTVTVPVKQRPFGTQEFVTSPALGAVLARRRVGANHAVKTEVSAVTADAELALRSSRRLRKVSLGTRIRNWMHLSVGHETRR